MSDKQRVMGAAAEASEPALSASPTEPLCVSSLPGDGQAQESLQWIISHCDKMRPLIADDWFELAEISLHARAALAALETSSRQEERLRALERVYQQWVGEEAEQIDVIEAVARLFPPPHAKDAADV